MRAVMGGSQNAVLFQEPQHSVVVTAHRPKNRDEPRHGLVGTELGGEAPLPAVDSVA